MGRARGHCGIGLKGFRNHALTVRLPGAGATRIHALTAIGNVRVRNGKMQGTVRDIDLDAIAILDQTDQATFRCFGDMWPMDRPELPPEKRPSVIRAQTLPKPFDFR